MITDQRMRGMSGLQTAIRVVLANLPVLTANGHAELSLETEGTSLPLIKPYTQQQLADTTSSCMGVDPFIHPIKPSLYFLRALFFCRER